MKEDDQTGSDGLLEPPESVPWWYVPAIALGISLTFGLLAWLVLATT